jgi:hypothetical protein
MIALTCCGYSAGGYPLSSVRTATLKATRIYIAANPSTKKTGGHGKKIVAPPIAMQDRRVKS